MNLLSTQIVLPLQEIQEKKNQDCKLGGQGISGHTIAAFSLIL